MKTSKFKAILLLTLMVATGAKAQTYQAYNFRVIASLGNYHAAP
jgi:hypothetical protein